MKPDCFAYKNGDCNILKKVDCEDCNFYKTEKERLESSIHALDIILAKDSKTLEFINKTYYNRQILKRRKALIEKLNALSK